MKKYLFAFFLILSIPVFSQSNSVGKIEEKNTVAQPYASKEGKFSLNLPSDWEIRHGFMGTDVLALAPNKKTAHLRFDIHFLSERVSEITNWLSKNEATKNLFIGYFGSSTGAAAALVAASERGDQIKAVVSRGGRPDLALHALQHVKAPTLLIVGGDDHGVIELNQSAYEQLKTKKKLEIVPHASHLFQEPGTLEQVANLASYWFKQHLNRF